MNHLIAQCNGLFGKVVADLIAEGQGDPSILKDLYESHIEPRRASTVAAIERGMASGEFLTDTKPELLLDAMVAPIYLRLLLRPAALTQEYGAASGRPGTARYPFASVDPRAGEGKTGYGDSQFRLARFSTVRSVRVSRGPVSHRSGGPCEGSLLTGR